MGQVHEVWARLEAELAQGPVAVLDLADVTDCDSSAVALLLQMRRRGVAEFRHFPASMQAILTACQLESLLMGKPASPPSV